MPAQGDSTSVLDTPVDTAAAVSAPAEQPNELPDSGTEPSEGGPLSFDESDTQVLSGDDPGDEIETDEPVETAETTDEAEPEDEPKVEAKVETTTDAAKATADERRELMASIRAELSGKPAEPKAEAKAAEPAAKPEAKAATPATDNAFGTIDPDAIVKQFEGEFGADAAKAITPLAKQVKALTDFVSNMQVQTKAQEEQAAAYKVHQFFDKLATDGLEQHIGNGSKAALSQEQVVAREELFDAARFLIQKDRAKNAGKATLSDEDAVQKAALLLFDVKMSKKDAVAQVRDQLKQRHASRTVRPRASAPKLADHKADTSSWADDDDETSRVKAELRQEGYSV